jgi:catechol 2,3-dioxygenase-like lactoylglutathione lyase family enzyme
MNPYPSRDLGFSHLGFHVHALERMARFYREALQFTETDRGQLGAVELVFLSRDRTCTTRSRWSLDGPSTWRSTRSTRFH